MHTDIVKVSSSEVKKPIGDIFIVYFSSTSNNTHRFIQKLNFKNNRIPFNNNKKLIVKNNYILVTPTYGGGGNISVGAVPKQVINFLNNKENRENCRGVIASGNTNFGDTFAIAGPIISKKINVPMLYQFELLGTKSDIKNTRKIINDFWGETNNEK